MYRIEKDKRKTQSAQLICKGLEELMRTSNYNDITVTQIINSSGIGRATFYRLFDDKSDVVLYRMETVFTELLGRLGPETDSNVVVESLFDLWLSQKGLFLSLIQANLYGEFQTRLSFVIEKKLEFIKKDIGLDSRSWQYFIHIRAAMLFTALQVAITQYKEDDSQDIVNTLNDLFGKQPVIF